MPTKRISHYIFKQELGHGSFGNVYLGKDLNTGQKVAIKVIPNSKLGPDSMREIEIMRNLKHENIVELYNDLKTDTQTFLFLELCQGGTLEGLIKSSKGLGESKTRFFLKQMVEALKYLKIERIIHRDLKPANILLDSDHNIKIADFGLARILDPDSLAKTVLGTPLYMAPELMRKLELRDNIERYGRKADIWSVGCIVYELITGQILFQASSQDELNERIKDNIERKPYLAEYDFSEVCMDFLVKVIAYEDKRLSIEEFCEHPFVTGLPAIPRALLLRGETNIGKELEEKQSEYEEVVIQYSKAVIFLVNEGMRISYLLNFRACELLKSIKIDKLSASLFAQNFVFIDKNADFKQITSRKIAEEIITTAVSIYETYKKDSKYREFFKAASALLAILEDNYFVIRLIRAFSSY